MLCRRYIIMLVLLALGLVQDRLASAQGGQSSGLIFSAQRMAEDRITSLMHGYDEDTLVFVSFLPKTIEAAKLPGTPFNVKELTLPFANGGLPFATAEVTIFTKSGQVNKAASTAISDVLRPFASELNLKVRKLPSGYVSPFAKSQQERKKEIESQRAWEERVRREQRAWELEQAKQEKKEGESGNAGKLSGADSVKDYTGVLNTGWKRLDRITIAIAVSVGAMVVLQLVLFIIAVNLSRKRDKNYAQYVSQISSALESSGGGGSSAPTGMGGQASGGASTTVVGKGDDTDRDALNESDNKALLALLTDCYWTESDSYAAFIWKRLSMARRQQLMGMWPYMDSYATYLTGQEETNEGWAQHPYYLNPLSLEFVDSEQLTNEVKNQPSLLSILPPLRLNGLQLTAVERVSLEEAAKDAKPTTLPKFVPAQPRKLQIRRTITINSVDEEIALMEQSIPAEMREYIPSLIWSRDLTDQDLESILERYSARDLALAWIGPPVILDRFLQLLPSKKRNLLSVMIERQKPNRGPVYQAIYRDVMSVLRRKNQDVSDELESGDESKQTA